MKILKHKQSGLILKEAILRGKHGDSQIWIAPDGQAVWGVEPNAPERRY